MLLAGSARADQIQSGQAINVNLNDMTTGATVYVANQMPVTVTVSSVNVTGSTVTMTNAYMMVGGTVTAALQAGTGVFVDGSAMVFFPSAQPVNATSVNVGTVTVNGSVPVTGTFWQATQPVSGAVSVSNFVAPSTHTAVDNFPASQAVTGAFFQATQPVSGTVSVAGQVATSTHVIVDNQVAASTHVAVDNFPATQAVSGTLGLASSTNTVGSVSLGSSVGKTAVLKTGTLVTTAVTANQVVSTYTVTAGKTFYLEYITASARLTVQSATASILGTFAFQVSGTNVLTETNTNNTTEQVYPMVYMFTEPIPFAGGTGIAVVCTPGATTSMTWTANFGGYER